MWRAGEKEGGRETQREREDGGRKADKAFLNRVSAESKAPAWWFLPRLGKNGGGETVPQNHHDCRPEGVCI